MTICTVCSQQISDNCVILYICIYPIVYQPCCVKYHTHTVDKLRSIHFLFSSMYCIESKAYVEVEDFSFTFIDAEDYASGKIFSVSVAHR
jgi:hypothetical protein